MRTIAWAALAVLCAASVLNADGQSVSVDRNVDFSTFKTFSMRDGRIRSDRSELKLPAVMSSLREAIRTALTGRGLTEANGPADLIVEHSVTNVDYRFSSFERVHMVREGVRGVRGSDSVNPGQVDFTQATLVIELKRGDTGALVWRGVYHYSENDTRQLALALPGDAAKLVTQYWPKRRN